MWCNTITLTLALQQLLFIHMLLFSFSRPKARSAASLILRGANDFMCDEMERSVHDALCVVKRVLESKTVVPGGGAVEAALSIYLENFATSLVSFQWGQSIIRIVCVCLKTWQYFSYIVVVSRETCNSSKRILQSSLVCMTRHLCV